MKFLTIAAALAIRKFDDEDFAQGVDNKVFGGYITDEFHNTRNGYLPGQETPELFPEPKAKHNSQTVQVQPKADAGLPDKYKKDYDEEAALKEISEF